MRKPIVFIGAVKRNRIFSLGEKISHCGNLTQSNVFISVSREQPERFFTSEEIRKREQDGAEVSNSDIAQGILC